METVQKYRIFAESLSKQELENLVITINDEEKWIPLSHKSLFLSGLKKEGICITSKEELDYFGNVIYGELRRKTKDLPPYITGVDEKKNKSFEELHWIPNEPIAFDSDDPEWPSPFYIALPYRILPGEHEGGFKIIFLLNEREDFTLYTHYPLIGIWGSLHKIYESKNRSIIASSAYTGKKAIIDRLNEYDYFREYAKELSAGNLSLLKPKDKVKIKEILNALKGK